MPDCLSGHFGQFNPAHAENGGVQKVVKRLYPFFVDGPSAVSHAENRAHGCAVAVGVKAGLHGHADGLAVVTSAVEEGGRHDHGVGDGVTPVVSVVLVETGVDGGEAVGLGHAASVAVHYGHDGLVQAGGGGDLPKPPADHGLHAVGGIPVLYHGGHGQHGGYPHLAVDAVLDVGDGGVPPGHVGGGLGVSGVDVAEIVPTDLGADPLAVGVLVYGRIGGQVALDKVAEGRPLGGAVGVLGLHTEPMAGHIGRGNFK